MFYDKHFKNKYLIQTTDCNNTFFLSDTQHSRHTHTPHKHTSVYVHTCTHATLLERLAIRSPSCSITLTNTFSFTREHGHIKGQPGLIGTLLVEHKGKSFLSLKTELGTAHSWWLSQFSAEDFKAGRDVVRTHWTAGPKAAVSPSFHGNLNTDYFYFVESE